MPSQTPFDNEETIGEVLIPIDEQTMRHLADAQKSITLAAQGHKERLGLTKSFYGSPGSTIANITIPTDTKEMETPAETQEGVKQTGMSENTYSKSEIDSKFQAFRADVNADMLKIASDIKSSISSEMKSLRDELKSEIGSVKTEISGLKTDINSMKVEQAVIKTNSDWIRCLCWAILAALVGGLIKLIFFP